MKAPCAPSAPRSRVTPCGPPFGIRLEDAGVSAAHRGAARQSSSASSGVEADRLRRRGKRGRRGAEVPRRLVTRKANEAGAIPGRGGGRDDRDKAPRARGPVVPHPSRPASSAPEIAVSGAPAFGTRVRWTTRLVTALTAIVGPEQALGLMAHWLEHRDHRSESLLVDPDVVKAETERIVRSKYKHAGVPVRFWQHVRSLTDSFFHSRRRKDRYWDSLAERLKKRSSSPRRSTGRPSGS